jgi:hypothetical protein
MTVPARKSSGVAKGSRSGKATSKPPKSSVSSSATRKHSDGAYRPRKGIGGELKMPESGIVGQIRIAAGPAFGAATRLKIPGINTAHEKQKLSITLDKPIVGEQAAMSTSINDLLRGALAQYRLNALVDSMEEEAGPASADAYERVFAQWFEEA